MQISKRKTLIWSLAAIMLAGLSSCLKNDSSVEPPKPQSYVSIVNMSYRAPAVEVYFGGEKVTAPMNPGTFFSRYSPIDPAILNVSFKKSSSDSLVASLPPSQIYDSSSFYTLLLYDQPFGGAAAVRLQDDFSQLSSSKTHFRFFNMVPELTAVDLYLNSTKVAANRSPADNADIPQYNEFMPYEGNVYSLTVKAAGTDSVVATQSTVDLSNAYAYTIMLKGRPGGTGDNAVGIVVLRASN
jgi:hypothetical protein